MQNCPHVATDFRIGVADCSVHAIYRGMTNSGSVDGPRLRVEFLRHLDCGARVQHQLMQWRQVDGALCRVAIGQIAAATLPDCTDLPLVGAEL